MNLKNYSIHLIKLSERIFKTDMIYVTKNGFWIFINQITTLIITLVLSILFANLLPMHEYGVYKYIISFVGILGAFKLTGMASIVVQASSKGFDGILKSAIKETLLWGLIPLGIAIVSASYYFFKNDTLIALAIVLATILNILIGAYGLYGSYLNGKQNFKLSTKFSIVTQIVTALAVIGTLLVSHNVLYLIIANFLATAMMVGVFSFITIKQIPIEREINDTNSIKLGRHMSAMNVLAHIVSNLDKIILFQKLGSIELAIYSFAIAIPEQVKGTYKNFLAIAIPKYATLSKSALRFSIIRKTITLTALTSGIIILYVLIAPYIFQSLFPQYIESVFYSQLYISGLLLVPGMILFQTYFQAQHLTEELYKINVIGNIVNLILTIVMIYLFGLIGAIFLSVLTKATTLSLSLWYFYKDKNT